MKITICGSIAFFDRMRECKNRLELLGHDVKIPPVLIQDNSSKMIPVQEYYQRRKAASADDEWVWDRKRQAMLDHFNKVAWAEAILVLNYEKNNVAGYIGANTFLEMGLAMHLQKRIYLLNPVPETPIKEELLGMKPVVIHRDISRIAMA